MVVNQLVKLSSTEDILNAVFAALADPTRRSILARLDRQDVTVSELAEPYDMSVPAVSKHVKVLEQAGLISKRKVAQQRVCHLEVEHLAATTQWLDTYRRLWEANLDNLDLYLQQLQSNNKE